MSSRTRGGPAGARSSPDFPSEEFRSRRLPRPPPLPPASAAAYAWRVLADVACNGADGAHRTPAEISKNDFLITSLIAPVSSLTFRTIRRTSCAAPALPRDSNVSQLPPPTHPNTITSPHLSASPGVCSPPFSLQLGRVSCSAVNLFLGRGGGHN